jgi:hypothetical protein
METFMFNGAIDWEEVIKTIVLFGLVIGIPLVCITKGFIDGYRGKNVK